MTSLLTVSPSPHVRSGMTTQKIMLLVVLALVPAIVAATVVFGPRALFLVVFCAVISMFTEMVCQKLMQKETTYTDGSAMLTGVLLALNLPATLPLWEAAIGCVFAIAVVKQLFGGIGKNFANPALVGRIVLFLSFSKTMTAWVFPDAVSSATPLAQLAAGQKPELLTLLLGSHGGCIGETCALALLLGGAYLLIRGVITWQAPVCFVGTVFVLSLVLGQDALRQVLSGGLLLGAFFMATDYVTAPQTYWGRALFGIGAGLLTCLIRFYGSYAEGVSFAILFMNILTPYLSRWTQSKPLGGAKA